MNLTHINLRENSIGGPAVEMFIKHLQVRHDQRLKYLNLANNFINEVLAMKLIKTLNSDDGPS